MTDTKKRDGSDSLDELVSHDYYKEAYEKANDYMRNDDKLSKIKFTDVDWGTVRDRLADIYVEAMTQANS